MIFEMTEANVATKRLCLRKPARQRFVFKPPTRKSQICACNYDIYLADSKGPLWHRWQTRRKWFPKCVASSLSTLATVWAVCWFNVACSIVVHLFAINCWPRNQGLDSWSHCVVFCTWCQEDFFFQAYHARHGYGYPAARPAARKTILGVLSRTTVRG